MQFTISLIAALMATARAMPQPVTDARNVGATELELYERGPMAIPTDKIPEGAEVIRGTKEAYDVLNRLKSKRAIMVETGPIFLCAGLCKKDDNKGCTGTCPKGKGPCVIYCD